MKTNLNSFVEQANAKKIVAHVAGNLIISTILYITPPTLHGGST